MRSQADPRWVASCKNVLVAKPIVELEQTNLKVQIHVKFNLAELIADQSIF